MSCKKFCLRLFTGLIASSLLGCAGKCYFSQDVAANHRELVTTCKRNAILDPIGRLKTATEYKTIQCNSVITVSLKAGENAHFSFTPSVNGYYVIETFGAQDTILSVESGTLGTVGDDNGGDHLNARVAFVGKKNDNVLITAGFHFLNNFGSFRIQVRRQTISMFAYVDSEGRSTIPDMNGPANSFSQKFDVKKYPNGSADQAISFDERHLSRLNSEVAFFSGHGATNGMAIYFKTGMIDLHSSLDLTSTRVALWAACCSANDNNSELTSFAARACSWGAYSSVGFKKTISFASSKTFSDRFFSKLAAGSTVGNAARYGADGIIWPWDSIKQYVVFGNDEIRVTDLTNTEPPSQKRSPKREPSHFLCDKTLDYSLGDGRIRRFETIDGCLTNSFVDITYEKDNVISIDDHLKRAPINRPSPRHFSGNSLNKTFVNRTLESHVVYVLLDGAMTPVELLYEDRLINGYVVQNVTCTNLVDGSEIDYSQINSVSSFEEL